jgi:ribosomal protein L40E
MQSFRLLLSRFQQWRMARQNRRGPLVSGMPVLLPFQPPIIREVSAHGVRVISLCAACGARLEASATLCEDCAQKQSRTRPC